MVSISEKDTQIAHLELSSPKTKRQEIKQMKAEKEKFVLELKEQVSSSSLKGKVKHNCFYVLQLSLSAIIFIVRT